MRGVLHGGLPSTKEMVSRQYDRHSPSQRKILRAAPAPACTASQSVQLRRALLPTCPVTESMSGIHAASPGGRHAAHGLRRPGEQGQHVALSPSRIAAAPPHRPMGGRDGNRLPRPSGDSPQPGHSLCHKSKNLYLQKMERTVQAPPQTVRAAPRLLLSR